MIVLHELAHVRRWDNLVNLLQRLVEAVLFFHPSVWWLSRRVRLEREHCCDAVVLAHTGAPQRYAEFLAHLALPGIVPQRALGVSAGEQLVARIRHILNQENESMKVSRSSVIASFAFFVALIAVAIAWVHLQAAAAPVEIEASRRIPRIGGDGHISTTPQPPHAAGGVPSVTLVAQATTPGPSEPPPVRGSASPPTDKKTDDHRQSGGIPMGGRPGVREKYAEVGLVDLDNNGVSDRDVLHELVQAANGEIVDEVDDHGVRHPPGGNLTIATKFLVIGKIPDYSQSKPNEKEFHRKIAEIETKMVNQATENGVRVISIEDFLNYIGYDRGRRLGRPSATTKRNLRSGSEGSSLAQATTPTAVEAPQPSGTASPPVVNKLEGRQPAFGSRIGGMRLSASSPAEQEKAQLKFAGRPFWQWETVLMTELDPKMRVEALDALGRFGSFGYEKEASDAIARFLSKGRLMRFDDGDHKVEEAAKEAFSRIGPPALPTALGLLKDKSPEVRRLATEIVSALLYDGKEPKPSTVEVLAEATNDPDQHVRLAALQAIARILGARTKLDRSASHRTCIEEAARRFARNPPQRGQNAGTTRPVRLGGRSRPDGGLKGSSQRRSRCRRLRRSAIGDRRLVPMRSYASHARSRVLRAALQSAGRFPHSASRDTGL